MTIPSLIIIIKRKTMNPITVLIADDHRLLRETLGEMLHSDPRFDLLATCNSEIAMLTVMQKKPDIVLMGINILPFSGIDAMEKMWGYPNTKVVALSVHAKPLYAKKMMSMGAGGYVTKNSSKEEIFAAIIAVAEGKKYICEEIRNAITDDLINQKQEVPDLNMLTKKETQIIQLVSSGLSSKEIAQTLFIACKTVEVHRHNILKKLKMRSSVAAVNLLTQYAGLQG